MPAWIGPAISAGASLLGGIFGSNRAREDARRAEKRADPKNVRKRFEAAGFNPLLGFGQMQANPGMASYALSNEILMNSLAEAGDGFGEAAVLRMQLTEQEREKARLEQLVHDATLGARVGGIYDAASQPSGPEDRARRSRRDADARSFGANTGRNSGGSANGGRSVGDTRELRAPADLLTAAPEGQYEHPGMDPAVIVDAGRTQNRVLGWDIIPAPWNTDAYLAEDRWGELDGNASGVNYGFRVLNDVAYTAYREHWDPAEQEQRDERLWQDEYPIGDFNQWDPRGGYPMTGGARR